MEMNTTTVINADTFCAILLRLNGEANPIKKNRLSKTSTRSNEYIKTFCVA